MTVMCCVCVYDLFSFNVFPNNRHLTAEGVGREESGILGGQASIADGSMNECHG